MRKSLLTICFVLVCNSTFADSFAQQAACLAGASTIMREYGADTTAIDNEANRLLRLGLDEWEKAGEPPQAPAPMSARLKALDVDAKIKTLMESRERAIRAGVDPSMTTEMAMAIAKSCAN